jgi:hypothetical protein
MPADDIPAVEAASAAGPCHTVEDSRTLDLMREPLITAALLSIFVSTRGTAKALGAIQRLY